MINMSETSNSRGTPPRSSAMRNASSKFSLWLFFDKLLKSNASGKKWCVKAQNASPSAHDEDRLVTDTFWNQDEIGHGFLMHRKTKWFNKPDSQLLALDTIEVDLL